MPFEIDFDYEARTGLALHIRHRLGPAPREQFPRALELNGQFSFGRLGVVTDAATGALCFEFSDRRLYAFSSGSRLAAVLSTIALELSDLLDREEW